MRSSPEAERSWRTVRRVVWYVSPEGAVRASTARLLLPITMIGISSSSRSFKSLGRYLVIGRDRENEGRVAWSASRNLPTEEPEVAAKIMRATAAQNVRTEKPVYHLALSFDPKDVVDRSAMERVADRVLSELGLREHQALIVAHGDRHHPHVHILVNRVHPVSTKVWDRWQDYVVVQSVLREEERALGLRQVDGGSARAADQQSVGSRTEQLPSSTSRGAYYGNRGILASIRGDLDSHDLKTHESRHRYALGINVASLEVRIRQLDETIRRVQRLDDAFTRSLGGIFRDVQLAKSCFLRSASELGADEALRRLRELPQQLGRLRDELGAATRGTVQVDGNRAEALNAASARGAEFLAARRDLTTLLQRTMGQSAVDIDSPMIDRVVTNARDQLQAARDEVRALHLRSSGEQTLAQLEFRLSQAIRRLGPPEFAKLCLTLSGNQLSLAHKLRGVARDLLLGREEAR